MDALARSIRWLAGAMVLIVLSASGAALAQESPAESPPMFQPSPSAKLAAPASSVGAASSPFSLPLSLPDLSKRENFSSAMQIIILLTVLSLAPAILLMMTSFTRIIIVLSLLRQALGTQQLPPNQILIGLALFMTFLVMGPTWQRVNNEALQPYMDGKMEQKDDLEQLFRPPGDEFANAGGLLPNNLGLEFQEPFGRCF